MDAADTRPFRGRGGDVAGSIHRICIDTPPQRGHSHSVSESPGLSALPPSGSPLPSWSSTRADPAPYVGNICLGTW